MLQTYLISNGSSVKIGKSDNVLSRMAQLQVSSPIKLSLLKCIDGDCEKYLHHRFAKQRQLGEWFDLDDSPNGVRQFLSNIENISTQNQLERIIRRDESLTYSYETNLIYTNVWHNSGELVCGICREVYHRESHGHLEWEPQCISNTSSDRTWRLPIRGHCGHRWSIEFYSHGGTTSIRICSALKEDFK